jgi:hypothetical protein
MQNVRLVADDGIGSRYPNRPDGCLAPCVIGNSLAQWPQLDVEQAGANVIMVRDSHAIAQENMKTI